MIALPPDVPRWNGHERRRRWWRSPVLLYVLVFLVYAAAAELRIVAARSDGIDRLEREVRALRLYLETHR